MKKVLLMVLLTITTLSCEFEYALDQGADSYTPKIVVNSIITPQQNIKVYFNWSKHYTTQEYNYHENVPSGNMHLYEDGKHIEEIDIIGSSAYSSFKPQAGKRYRIVANIDGYGVAKAETYVPHVGEANGVFKEKRITNNEDWSVYHIQLSGISSQDKVQGVWIRAKSSYYFENEYTSIYEQKPSISGRIYSNNMYIDNFNINIEKNSEAYDGLIQEHGGSIYYPCFVRLPNKVIGDAQPLELSALLSNTFITTGQIQPNSFPQYETLYIPINNFVAEVIFPSNDYDKYVKGIYRQSELSFNPDFPLFSEAVYVHSNIKNGLGIFAGYNSKVLEIPVK